MSEWGRELLDWPPILWTLRVAIVIVTGALGLAVFLYFARFLRPKHLKAMLLADIPRVSEFGGEFGGNKFAVKLDRTQGEQLKALEDQFLTLETAVRRLAEQEPRPKDEP